MHSIRGFLEKRLKLKVNEEKSSVDRPWKLEYLGFSMYKSKERILIRLAPQTMERVKNKIREFTSRTKPVSMADRIRRINAYLGGWLGYFALAETEASPNPLPRAARTRLTTMGCTRVRQLS